MRTTLVHTRQSGCFLKNKQTTVIWNFHKMPFVCLLPNKQVQFITKMRAVPTGDEHKGGMVKDEQMTLSARKPFSSPKTRNWTQRIILKHLKREDVGNVNFELLPQCHCWRTPAHPRPPPPLRRRHPHPRLHRPHCQSSHLCC